MQDRQADVEIFIRAKVFLNAVVLKRDPFDPRDLNKLILLIILR